MDNKNALRCSFCGKTQKEVKTLIAGPSVYICDECVALCFEVILDRDTGKLDIIRRLNTLSNSDTWSFCVLFRTEGGQFILSFGGNDRVEFSFENQQVILEALKSRFVKLIPVINGLSELDKRKYELQKRLAELEESHREAERIKAELEGIDQRIAAHSNETIVPE